MTGIRSGPTFAQQRDIFLEALQQPTEEARAALIARATEGNPSLRGVIETLLAQHRDDTFLEHPATNFSGDASAPKFRGEEVGQMIGRYKLLELIGEGGCGTVFLAEQKEPVRRRVAIKLIKLGMDTKSVVARFEAERQALALMDHPCIARILDGGATPAGRPYFVMELVRGVRITDYCAANKLPMAERLLLFGELCQAIQHAHQKGVIHRDIKPSNVLVTLQDGRAMPKVIDFGIAKAIEEPLTEKTVFTHFHAFLGTPAYTSPEQAQMTSVDVDTRTDIYSLGVLLYELLTGTTPFDPKELAKSGLDEMRRMIKEVDPPRPSTRVSHPRLNPDTADVAFPGIDPDLDWIIMKCLEKDRDRRYSTAQELAIDLQRYRSHEPVLARPPSTGYRLRKAVHRNSGAFAAATAILVALLLGAGLSFWQAIRATNAERAAEKGRIREVLLRQKAERERERALENQRRAEINEYVADINLADQSITAGNLSRALDLLRKHDHFSKNDDPRGFEWHYLWKLAQGDEHSVLATEPSSVLSLAVTPQLLAVGLRDAVNIYRFPAGTLLKSLARPGLSVEFSGSGLLATASPGTVRLWRISDWTETLTLSNHSAPISFSGDGRLLAANSRSGIRIVNTSDGVTLSQLSGAVPPVAFAPTGNALVANSRDGIAIWESSNAKPLRPLENSSRIMDRGWTRERPLLQFSPDGRFIAAARNVFRSGGVFALELWESSTGSHVATFPGEREIPEHTGLISGIAFSPDGAFLASASWDHSIRLWDLADLRCVKRMHGSLSEVWALAFSPDGQRVISGCKDGTVSTWPASYSQSDEFLPGNWTPLHFSEDGRILAALKDEDTLAMLNIKTREVEAEIPLRPGGPRFPNPFAQRVLTKDLRLLAEPGNAGIVRLWNLQARELTELQTTQLRLDTLALSPDGFSLLTSEHHGPLLCWDLQRHSPEPKEIPGERALFSDDGKNLVALSQHGFAVWNWPERSPQTNFVLQTPIGWAAALSPDARLLATGSDVQDIENAIRLWDTRTGKLIGICSGHTQGVEQCAFSPDGKTLASTSTDGSLRLWNVATQQQLLAIQQLGEPFHNLLFSPTGTCLVARSRAGQAPGLRILTGSQPER